MAWEQGPQASRKRQVLRASSVEGQISSPRGSRGVPVLPDAASFGEDTDPEAAPNGATGLNISTVARTRRDEPAVRLADMSDEARFVIRNQQALSRCLYLGSIVLFSRLLFQQRLMSASPRPSWRDTVARTTFEMVMAFLVVSICQFGILASHLVRVPRALRRHLCIGVWLFTSVWMIIYTFLIPSQLYRSWEWIITSSFVMLNLASASSVPALYDAWHHERMT